MKRSTVPLSFLFLVLCSCLLFPGCRTPEGTPVVSPLRVQKASTLAAYATARLMMVRQPETLPALTKAAQGFNDLVATSTWDIATAAAIARANGLTFLESDEANIALIGLPMFIDLFWGTNVDLSANEYTKAFIVGASEGLNLALSVPQVAARQGGPIPGDAVEQQLLKSAKLAR